MSLWSGHLVILTRDDVTEPYGGHGDEAEVEGVEESPAFKQGEEEGATTEENTEEEECPSHCVQVGGETHFFVIIPGED